MESPTPEKIGLIRDELGPVAKLINGNPFNEFFVYLAALGEGDQELSMFVLDRDIEPGDYFLTMNEMHDNRAAPIKVIQKTRLEIDRNTLTSQNVDITNNGKIAIRFRTDDQGNFLWDVGSEYHKYDFKHFIATVFASAREILVEIPDRVLH